MSDKLMKNEELFGNYYNKINELILKTKQNVVKNINYEMVDLYYEIGSAINELIVKYNLESSQNVNVNIELDKNVNVGIGQVVPILFKLNDTIILSFLKIDRS